MSKVFRLLAPLALVLFVAQARADDKDKPKTGDKPKPEAKKGYIGIQIKTGENEKGIIVQMVMDDSPAAKGGLKDNDEIVKLNGKEVGGLEDFVNAVRATKVGDKITLTVKREGKEVEVKITAGALPEPKEDK